MSFRFHSIVVAGILGLTNAPCLAQHAEVASGASSPAPLLQNLGTHVHPVSTKSPLAQRYFNQGLILHYSFNHAEALRSFEAAAKADPECAMAHWGAALTLGPNINAGMDKESVPIAWEHLSKALALSVKSSERERAYVQALAKRYDKDPNADRSKLDEAYADAMRDLAKRFPDDSDAGALCAEALMVLHPWDFWTRDGKIKPWTEEITNLLETVMAAEPNHPGACHLYIHAVEASRTANRATAAADRLRHLVPGAGHMVHMPSHIYIRTGRYADGSEANEAAIKADQDYVSQCHAQGIYPLAYMPHNWHFLWACATLEGRSERAIEAARTMADRVDSKTMRGPGMSTLQHYKATPILAYARFGKWDAILGEPEPEKDLPYLRSVWHYARGLAFTRTGKLAEADAELAKLRAFAEDPTMKQFSVWDINYGDKLLGIASAVVEAEIAAARKSWEPAIAALRRAVEMEDSLRYDEPSTWHHPVRQILGAVLLEAGKPKEAEEAYRQDLLEYPENGWSLFGLHLALKAQGKTFESEKLKGRFDLAFKRADVVLKSSRF